MRRIHSVPSSPRPRASARTGGDGANSPRGPIPPLAAVAEVAVAVPECEVRVRGGGRERAGSAQALLGSCPCSGAVPDRELSQAQNGLLDSLFQSSWGWLLHIRVCARASARASVCFGVVAGKSWVG